MASTAASLPTGFRRILAWPRVRFTLIVASIFGLLMGLHTGAVPVFILRAVMVGFVILLIFGWLERWPRGLPRWLPRTVLRLIAIAISISAVT